jgi:hypothetical protein
MTVHLAEARLVLPHLWTPPTSRSLKDWIEYFQSGERGGAATGDAMTTFLANEILDHVFSLATYTGPANITTALYTAAPSDAGGGTEVTGGAYARVSQTNNATNWPAASSGSKSNGTTMTFPTATADWGTVTHVGLFDGSTNLLMWGALNTSRVVKNGDIFAFAATKLVLAFT